MATAIATLPGPRRRPRNYEGRAGGRSPVPDIYFVKHIDNSRLHREVDAQRRSECYSLLGLGILVFLFGLLFAWQHFECVRYGYQIQELKGQQAALEEWNRQLRLEQASLVDPQRIDAYARQKLGLAPPAPQHIIHIGPAPRAPMSEPVLARAIPAVDFHSTTGFERAEGELRREP